jgi:hypothetical protein
MTMTYHYKHLIFTNCPTQIRTDCVMCTYALHCNMQMLSWLGPNSDTVSVWVFKNLVRIQLSYKIWHSVQITVIKNYPVHLKVFYISCFRWKNFNFFIFNRTICMLLRNFQFTCQSSITNFLFSYWLCP